LISLLKPKRNTKNYIIYGPITCGPISILRYYICQSQLNIKLSGDSVKKLIAYQKIGSIIQGAAIEIGISISSVHCIIGKMNISVITDHDIAYYNVLIR